MDADKNLTAVFIKLPSLTLNGNQVTSGTVSLTNGTVNAVPPPNASAGRYRAGTQIALTGVPTLGYGVLSWSGACAGTSGPVCTIVADGDKSAQVTFAPINLFVNGQLMDTNVKIVTNGSVTIDPPPDVPPALYTYNSTVKITVNPNAGFKFGKWTGACEGQGPTCTLTMNVARQTAVELVPS
jgi:hypothetical protein